MKLTKKLEREILEVYHKYWDAYLKGDMRIMSSLMDENIRMIGSGQGEVFNNKKETVKYYKATAHQVAGKSEMRNRKITLAAAGNNILVTEESDFFILMDTTWTFYGQGRISTLFGKTGDKRLIIQQHGSLPDARTAGGEQINTDKIKEENIRLKDAVKRRTIELEEKNRKLEIEAALERVRTVAMSMEKPDDILKICEALFKELQKSGFSELRNALINTFVDEKNYFIDYAYSDFTGGTISRIPYSGHPVIERFIREIRKANDAFIEIEITAKELDEWKTFRKSNNEADDSRLDNIKSLFYYFYSIGKAGIGISTYRSVNKRKQNVLKRFRNVFDLAYKRYKDIEKAEAQAKEARIETSLERVRAVAMAMKKSKEVINVCEVMYKELLQLGFTNIRNAQIALKNQTRESYLICAYSDYEVVTLQEAPYNSSPIVKDLFDELEKSKDAFYKREFSGKQFEDWRKWRESLYPLSDGREITASSLCFYLYSIGDGHLGISTYNAITNEQVEIVKRFKNVFELSYQRYADVAKAEAQAREAQVELALERVRARTMAMQKSDELMETSFVLFQQFKELGETSEQISIGIFKEEENIMELYSTLYGSKWKDAARVDLDEPVVMKKIYAAWKERKKSLVIDITGGDLRNYNVYRRKLSNLDYREDRWVIHIAFFSKGVLTFSTTEPHPPETIQLLERFAGVFDGTYTRFLDLKKAEAQAREADIEISLERVRSKAMAMQKSEDLAPAVAVVFQELDRLKLDIMRCGIGIIDKEKISADIWTTTKSENETIVEVSGDESMTIHPLLQGAYDAWLSQKEDYSYELAGEDLLQFYHALSATNFQLPNSQDIGTVNAGARHYYYVTTFHYGGLYAFRNVPFSTEGKTVMKRFAGVFNLTYKRFLDLQRAESQAREAQIEAALERVRAKTMAMHKSEQLSETAKVFFEQFDLLGKIPDRMSIGIINEESQKVELWVTDQSGNEVNHEYFFSLDERTSIAEIYSAWKERKDMIIVDLTGQDLQDWLRFVKEEARLPIDETKIKGRRVQQAAFFSRGFLLFTTHEPVADDIMKLLVRFAKVFDQTYTRFLDLQKAEAQAREAQIEAALERVRASAMAMHSSEDLLQVTHVLREQIALLGEKELESILIHIYDEKNDEFEAWYSYRHPEDEKGVVKNGKQILDWSKTARARKDKEKYHGKDSDYTIVADPTMLKEWYEYLFEVVPVVVELDDRGEILVPDVLYYNYSKFPAGRFCLLPIVKHLTIQRIY